MKTTKQVNNLLPLFSSDKWKSWTPRQEIAPIFNRRLDHDDTWLSLSSVDAFHAYGAWYCEVNDVLEGTSYEIMAEYETKQINYESVSVNMIVTWMDEVGKWLGREYVDTYEAAEDGLSRLKKVLDAPVGSETVKIELEFRWATGGSVIFRKASLCPVESARPRQVKLMTTYINPYGEHRSDLSANVQELLDTLELAGLEQPDLVCLSETLYDRSSGYSVQEVAQALNGELVQAICRKAKEIRSYVVFNFYEKDNCNYYNTSVLINRSGEVAGMYRKVHIPLFEAQDGVTPGSDYPVFETDFGTVGLLICWDQSFVESARCLRLKGAEIVCISTAGESKIQQIARAVDNGMYVVVAGINGDIVDGGSGKWIADPRSKPSRIINPNGVVLGEIGPDDSKVLGIEIDLNAKFMEYWMSVGPAFGDKRNLFARERRPDTY
ncbi:carbon-nitrogen hydrolase family protein [Paenibacillus sinopodophylli]|uniref:carbon-nitrogen hydrolase family protein n=1 Tax=Paenibacillus sinopodophylli TaxID=1837342 RepID=UPI00110D1970|nr:carbon-nitrogen hydrolase family protein [Paenibacillus sinopodophylli]